MHLLPADWYYRLLTSHGLNMLIFFIIFFEMAVLYFAGPIAPQLAGARAEARWASLRPDGAGAVLVEWMVWTGKADVLFTSYVPSWRPIRSTTWGSSCSRWARCSSSGIFFATLVVAKRERTYEGSVPLVTFGAPDRGDHRGDHPLHGAIDLHPDLLLVART